MTMAGVLRQRRSTALRLVGGRGVGSRKALERFEGT